MKTISPSWKIDKPKIVEESPSILLESDTSHSDISVTPKKKIDKALLSNKTK